eukprot:TRINITY_DN6275_c0_g3_i3.p1 TRINITY_DN6275_c0_g3~~TRINITY_DN6275_c0_g3_i3.p1  ORF type:complete len:125 (+),score=27.31 TRINITY_DN6275_c0_g3_i3:162-536(+)
MGLQPDRVKERSLLIRRLDSLLILSRDTLREIEADIYWCLSVFLSSVQDHYTFAQPGKQWYQRRVRGVILWKKMEGEGFWQKIESFFSGATESINVGQVHFSVLIDCSQLPHYINLPPERETQV